MNSHLQTIRTEMPFPVAAGRRDALLVHIYPTGPEMGQRYVLGADPLIVGRGDGCDIRINDHSVSRRHATVRACEAGWAVTDLGSTNGTFLNDVPVTASVLRDGDYLRVGNCIYRFLAGGNVEADYHEEIYRLTIIDGLTDVHNKRYLLEFLDRELARSERYRRPLALVLFDIDHFKRINDDLGHLAGDAVLRELAGRIKGQVRKEELLARYGGEEFAVVLPETPVADAVAFAERVRAAVVARLFEYDGRAFSVTVSLGVAGTMGQATSGPQELIARADKALYRAKDEGRGCVRVWADDAAGSLTGGRRRQGPCRPRRHRGALGPVAQPHDAARALDVAAGPVHPAAGVEVVQPVDVLVVVEVGVPGDDAREAPLPGASEGPAPHRLDHAADVLARRLEEVRRRPTDALNAAVAQVRRVAHPSQVHCGVEAVAVHHQVAVAARRQDVLVARLGPEQPGEEVGRSQGVAVGGDVVVAAQHHQLPRAGDAPQGVEDPPVARAEAAQVGAVHGVAVEDQAIEITFEQFGEQVGAAVPCPQVQVADDNGVHGSRGWVRGVPR
jgi:diguanylate cyclase (GGDEF)-like protein